MCSERTCSGGWIYGWKCECMCSLFVMMEWVSSVGICSSDPSTEALTSHLTSSVFPIKVTEVDSSCTSLSLPVTSPWPPRSRHHGEYSAVQRRADDKGFSRCANIVCLGDWKGHRMYIDIVCKKKGTRVGFLSPVEEFSILEENVLSLSCWQVT